MITSNAPWKDKNGIYQCDQKNCTNGCKSDICPLLRLDAALRFTDNKSCDWNEPYAITSKLVEEFPDYDRAWYNHGMVLVGMKDYRSARNAFIHAVRLTLHYDDAMAMFNNTNVMFNDYPGQSSNNMCHFLTNIAVDLGDIKKEEIEKYHDVEKDNAASVAIEMYDTMLEWNNSETGQKDVSEQVEFLLSMCIYEAFGDVFKLFYPWGKLKQEVIDYLQTLKENRENLVLSIPSIYTNTVYKDEDRQNPPLACMRFTAMVSAYSCFGLYEWGRWLGTNRDASKAMKVFRRACSGAYLFGVSLAKSLVREL